MKRAISILWIVPAVAFAMSCRDSPTDTSPTVLSPQFAKDKTCPGHPSCREESPSVIVEYPADAADQGMKIYGDGAGEYVPGECGVYSRLFVGGSGDAVMDPDGNYGRRDGDCLPDDPDHERRYIVLDYTQCVYPEGCAGLDVVAGSWFMNIQDVHNITVETETHAQFNTGQCAHGLRFDAAESVPEATVHNVWIKLINEEPRRWRVWTKPGQDIAVCRPDQHGNKPGEERMYFSLPFALEIEEVFPSP